MEQQQQYIALILVANEEANNNQREYYLKPLTEGDNYVASINRDLDNVLVYDQNEILLGIFKEEGFNKILDMFYVISAFEFEDLEQLREYVNNEPLKNTFPLIRFKNAEFEEEEEALSNALTGEVIMKGDWYHNKISSVIDGFIEGLEYITPFVTVKEVEVTKEDAMFDELGFYDNE